LVPFEPTSNAVALSPTSSSTGTEEGGPRASNEEDKVEEQTDPDVVMNDATASSLSAPPNDNDLPTWLAHMIGYLREVSEDDAWQDLVTEFIDFEKRGPPHGVS
jgi:hypothetical protein